jgi:hypothetical protein
MLVVGAVRVVTVEQLGDRRVGPEERRASRVTPVATAVERVLLSRVGVTVPCGLWHEEQVIFPRVVACATSASGSALLGGGRSRSGPELRRQRELVAGEWSSITLWCWCMRHRVNVGAPPEEAIALRVACQAHVIAARPVSGRLANVISWPLPLPPPASTWPCRPWQPRTRALPKCCAPGRNSRPIPSGRTSGRPPRGTPCRSRSHVPPVGRRRSRHGLLGWNRGGKPSRPTTSRRAREPARRRARPTASNAWHASSRTAGQANTCRVRDHLGGDQIPG